MKIQVKDGTKELFLWETPTSTSTMDLTQDLVTIANLQSKILKLTNAMEDLVAYGPSKPLVTTFIE